MEAVDLSVNLKLLVFLTDHVIITSGALLCDNPSRNILRDFSGGEQN